MLLSSAETVARYAAAPKLHYTWAQIVTKIEIFSALSPVHRFHFQHMILLLATSSYQLKAKRKKIAFIEQAILHMKHE
jgi:hypothetical protein